MKHHWIAPTSSRPIPANAVVAGYEADRSPIYVGRAYHEDQYLLAKVIPSKNCAYVSVEGCEIAKTDYEILAGENYRWFECFVGTMPRIAMQFGCMPDGEPLYIGRGHLDGSLVVGKFDFANRLLYIPFNGEERSIECCEILTCFSPPRWVAESVKNIPKDAVVGGQISSKLNVYVGRAFNEGELLPAKILPKAGGAYVCVAGKDVFTMNFEFLTGDGYSWVAAKHYYELPLGAVSSGRTKDGELVYIGRGHTNGEPCVGKIYPTEYALYVPYGGKEVRIRDYDVLVRNK
ncbi:uncharacterized protein LOC129912011 [Episyrphus balteatus]|uniref:uncharacterized protein LOC129912011 n=1 Tax=Episyrphus balteatus TaxID=286459 RepID=UPI002485E22C|nr:uncharacterized protein LOC129912011 [Episyrphus balteatus]